MVKRDATPTWTLHRDAQESLTTQHAYWTSIWQKWLYDGFAHAKWPFYDIFMMLIVDVFYDILGEFFLCSISSLLDEWHNLFCFSSLKTYVHQYFWNVLILCLCIKWLAIFQFSMIDILPWNPFANSTQTTRYMVHLYFMRNVT